MKDKQAEREADMKQAYLQGRADLEKENTELERKLEQTENDLADYQFNYPTIKELQQENEELKKDKDYFSDSLDKQIEATLKLDKENAELKEKLNFSTQYYQGEKIKEQLTKAKEIIKAFLDSSDLNIKHKAEEFLGEF